MYSPPPRTPPPPLQILRPSLKRRNRQLPHPKIFNWASWFSRGKHDITFETATPHSLTNALKGTVEKLLGRRIGWRWPFAPYEEELKRGQVRVRWISTRFGKKSSYVVPIEFMWEYERWIAEGSDDY